MRGSLKHYAARMLPQWILRPIKRQYFLASLDDAPGETDLEALRWLVSPGDTVLDLGANVGLYTKRLSQLAGESGTVFSVEPIPDTFDLLRYNVTKLGLSNVKLIAAAVSNANGTASIVVPTYETGAENCHRAHLVKKTDESQLRHCQVRTL